MAEKVTLIVKAANQGSLDQKIECDLDWVVQHVKEEISKTHPAKPSVQEQRLIYSGQLLQDTLLLKTVLRHPTENNEYTIHLVCSSPKSNSSTRRPQDQPPLRTSPPPVTAPVFANENVVRPDSPPESTTDGVRHRLITTEASPSPAGGPPQGFDPYFSNLSFPLQAADPIQQMAVMQQMYAQYMSSYMQYIQSGNMGSGILMQEASPTPPGTSIPQESPDQTSNARPRPQDPNGANDQDPQQRNAQMRVNPQAAAPEEEDDGIARDWLDYIYFASRMAVLLSIVYFYSNLARFMLVACTTIFIYLYQCGWFRLWRAEEQPPQAQDPQPPAAAANEPEANEAQPNAPPRPSSGDQEQQQQQEQEQQQERPGPEPASGSAAASRETLEEERGDAAAAHHQNQDSSEGENEAAQNAVEGQQTSTPNAIVDDLPPQPSLLALSWTFLITFFTSLIPEQHQIA